MSSAHDLAPKLGMTGVIATLTSFLGLTGWLWILWLITLVTDHFTGTIAACRAGAWSSYEARRGIWGKFASMIVVLVTAVLDFVIVEVLSLYTLPFEYPLRLSPIVLAWYILTELGSIIENADRLGAKLPPFLLRWIKQAKAKLPE